MRTYETTKKIKGHTYRYQVTVEESGKRRYRSLGRVAEAAVHSTTTPVAPQTAAKASPTDVPADPGYTQPERSVIIPQTAVESGGTAALYQTRSQEGEDSMAGVQIVNNRPYLLNGRQEHTLNGVLAPMELVTLISLTGMNTASELLKYSQFKIATSLASAQEAQEVAGKLSPTQQVAFDYMVTLYLETMGAINRDAMERIVALIVGTSVELDTRSGWQKFRDGLLGG